ncbi:TonB-dependent receptor [Salinisphaera sp. C84B14]|uniref:TonB-dependent receptor n=1 Tax=Salinisphaera sp. C84B14 TaxID=1304155 RepID=UPI003340A59A
MAYSKYARLLVPAAGMCLLGAGQPLFAQPQRANDNDRDSAAQSTLLAPISVEALAFDDQDPSQAIEPATVVAGPELVRKRGQSLGATLADTPGISSADFGQGVGRPVIRGQSGARVRVQENGLASADVSTLSQDHAVSIDPYSARQVEVLKGPSTLLYGSGAIGGVVNVVTDRIPMTAPDGITGEATLERGDSTLGQRLQRLDVTGGIGDFALNVQGLKRLTDDYEADNSRLIDNSATDTDTYSAGTSYSGDWGYVGGAVSHFGREYGIPGEEAQIRLTQDRYDLKGEVYDVAPGIKRLEFSGAYTDYLHTEGEETPEAFFDNKETEFRIAAEHAPVAGFTGIFGVQGFDRDFKAYGEEESFVPATDTQSLAAFWVEQRPLDDNWTVQGGLRVEYQEQDTSEGRSDTDHTPISVSLGAKRTIGDHYVFTATAGRYERAPATEELYSFGPHEATLTYERGNGNFGEEVANSFDLGLRRINGRLRFDTSLFYTKYDDYIYQRSVDAGVDADGTGTPASDGIADRVNEEGEFAPDGEFLLIDYAAADATFYGGEAEVGYDLIEGAHRLTARVLGDYVRAELDNDTNLPRITPGRYGVGLDYDSKTWLGSVEALRASRQDNEGPLEDETAGYTDLTAFVGYRLAGYDDTETMVYLRGDNLLDDEIVRSTSFLRVAQPGRSVIAGVNVKF